MMLLLMQAIFAGSLTFIRNNIYLLPAITLFSLAQVLLASTTMLALSSMSKSSRFVAVMYAGLFFFTAALFNALRGITGTQRVCVALADRGARAARRRDLPARSRATSCRRRWPALAVVVLIAGSIVILSAASAAWRSSHDAGDATCGKSLGSGDRSPASGNTAASGPPLVQADAAVEVVRAGQRPERRHRRRFRRASPACSGPNGAGKSTFMKLMTGQLKPSKGTITRARRADLGQPGASTRASASVPSRTRSTTG